MKCNSCGAEIMSGSAVCSNCGSPVESSVVQQPVQQQQYQQQQYYQPNYSNSIPSEYKPIGAWGYIGYNLLFAIPLIGLIMMFVFAFGGTGNINLRNYARSFLLVALLSIVIGLIFGVGIIGLLGMESMM